MRALFKGRTGISIIAALVLMLTWNLARGLNTADSVCRTERDHYHEDHQGKDPWGRPYEGGRTHTFSAGPNGVSGDSDDVTLFAQTPPYFVYRTYPRVVIELVLEGLALTAFWFALLTLIPPLSPHGWPLRLLRVWVESFVLAYPLCAVFCTLVFRDDIPRVPALLSEPSPVKSLGSIWLGALILSCLTAPLPPLPGSGGAHSSAAPSLT